MDRNPCLGCDLRDEDKNSRRCMECDDRVEYVSGLVGRTHASPKGYAGRAKGPCVAKAMQGMEGGNEMTILDDKVEDIIKEVCDEFGVEVSKLKAGGRRYNQTSARKRIAERLIANYGMTQKKIGELTGVSDQAISYLLKKAKAEGETAESKPEKTTDAVGILHKRYIGDDPERKASLQTERHPSSGYASKLRPDKPPSASPRQGKTEPKHEKTVTIDFSKHAELLERLKRYAKIEIRSIEDQILYFILHSLSWEETESGKIEE